MSNEIRTFPVSKYLTSIRNLLQTKVPAVWVNGVITQISERGRMVYLSIAEFAEGDVKPLATLPLYIFGSDFSKMSAKLKNLPAPFALKEQIKVNLLVESDFYVPYGKFQGRVLDIDPAYTIGELALTRRAILERLEKEGLLRKNAALPLAEVPLRVGLITGEGTAAFQDFCTTLASSGFAFEVIPAFARMQGNETENTILEALGILRTRDVDVVCIVRGGGSKTDLNYFDSEALCRAAALFPVPVLTGIGHEIDKSLLDFVAWESRITPTDCAKFLIERVTGAWADTQDLIREITAKIQSRLILNKERLKHFRERLSKNASGKFLSEKAALVQIGKNISKIPQFHLRTEHERLKRNKDGFTIGVQKILKLKLAHFELLETKVRLADPETLLARGYSLTYRKDGKPVRNGESLKSGDVLVTRFAQGSVESVVR